MYDYVNDFKFVLLSTLHLSRDFSNGVAEQIAVVVNTAELYLGGTQFESVKILAITRFPSLHPDICQSTSNKSWMCISKFLKSR
jgi:hypothetical protein